MDIAEIRQKFPQYSDLSDGELVRGLHSKFYADMPYADFLRGINFPSDIPLDRLSANEKAEVNDMQNRPFGSGVPKFAYDLGGKTTDLATEAGASPEVAAGLGYGTNVLTQAIPALASSFKFGGPGPAPLPDEGSIIQKGREFLPRWLMQSAVKPSVADLKAGNAGKAIGDMLEEGISPTSRGMTKAAKLADKLNEATDAAIAGSKAHVDVPAVIQRLDPLKSRAMLQVNPEADIGAIEKSISEFKNSPAISNAQSIPVQLAQKLKSGTYTSIGNKAYGELGSASTEAQKQLARGLREEVISQVPEIAGTLKRESSLRNIMEVAANRALMDANKNPLSLGTSIAAIMHDPLSAAGMWANASTPVKAMLARMLYTGTKPEVLTPLIVGGSEAANQERE